MNERQAPAVDVAQQARAAAGGDKAAARAVLDAIQDRVYELSLRMLGHPADAEDAAQEILVVVLTHLGSFRGESAFTTWVWRIAANYLARALARDAANGSPSRCSTSGFEPVYATSLPSARIRRRKLSRESFGFAAPRR